MPRALIVEKKELSASL